MAAVSINPGDTRPGASRKTQGFVGPRRWQVSYRDEDDTRKLKTALQERIKELNGLYALARIAEDRIDTITGILEAVIEIIPTSWQYPEITCARIDFMDHFVETPGFQWTRWRQSTPIKIYGSQLGQVAVCYSRESPPAFEGPFLREERILIEAIAERIGCMALRVITGSELKEVNRKLLTERKALEETNTALKVLMGRIQEERREVMRDVGDKVEKVLKPILYELSMAVPRTQRKYVDMIVDHLDEITEPFLCRLGDRFDMLSPTEIQICTMIRSGLRTKEIAELRRVSPATVCRHRDRIRHKLGLSNTRVNLATYLKQEM